MCSNDLTAVSMGLGWTWPNNTIYLDATCIGVSDTGVRLFFVDYSHKNSGDYITHSGDVLDMGQKSGEHTIKINLSKLPDNVRSLFFIITGYTTTIDAVKSPWVRLTNDNDKSELCRYTLEQAGAHRAVTMCRLYRDNPRGLWKVVAIGTLGDGCVSNYEPIHATIQNYLNNLAKK